MLLGTAVGAGVVVVPAVDAVATARVTTAGSGAAVVRGAAARTAGAVMLAVVVEPSPPFSPRNGVRRECRAQPPLTQTCMAAGATDDGEPASSVQAAHA